MPGEFVDAPGPTEQPAQPLQPQQQQGQFVDAPGPSAAQSQGQGQFVDAPGPQWQSGKIDWSKMPTPGDVGTARVPPPIAKYRGTLQKIAGEEGVPFDLAARIMGAETSGGADPKTWKPHDGGVDGPFQVKPGTAAEVGIDQASYLTPEGNIRAGVRYIKKLLDANNGDWTTVVRLYHDGENADVRHFSNDAITESDRAIGVKPLPPGGFGPMIGAHDAPNQPLPPGGMAAVLHASPTPQNAPNIIAQMRAKHQQPPSGPPPDGRVPNQPAPTPQPGASPGGPLAQKMATAQAPTLEAVRPIVKEVYNAAVAFPGLLANAAIDDLNDLWGAFAGPTGYTADHARGVFEVMETPARAMQETLAQGLDRMAGRLHDTDQGVDSKEAQWLRRAYPLTNFIPSLDGLGKIMHEAFTPEDTQAVLDHLTRSYNQNLGFGEGGFYDIEHQNRLLFALEELGVGTATDLTTYVAPEKILGIPGQVSRVLASSRLSAATGRQVMRHIYATNAPVGEAIYRAGSKAASVSKKVAETSAGQQVAHFSQIVGQKLVSMQQFTDKVGRGIADRFNHFVNDLAPHLNKDFEGPGKLAYMATASRVQTNLTHYEKEFANVFDGARQTIRDTLQQTGSTINNELEFAWRHAIDDKTRMQIERMGFQPKNNPANKMFPKATGHMAYTRIPPQEIKGGPLLVPEYHIGNIRHGTAAQWVIDAGGDLGKAMQAYQKSRAAFALGRTDLSGALAALAKPTKEFPDGIKMTADELVRAKSMLQRWSLGKTQIARTMAEFVHQAPNPSTYMKMDAKAGWSDVNHTFQRIFNLPPNQMAVIGRKVDKDLRKVPLFGDDLADALKKFHEGAAHISEDFKQGIQINPFPHGLWNVGVITAMRGGFGAAMKGLSYGLQLIHNEVTNAQARFAMSRGMYTGAAGAVKPIGPELQQKIDRVHAMGGNESYWREGINLARLPDFVRSIPGLGMALRGLGAGYKKFFNAVTQTLDHLETGYRIAYMEHLDKIYGKPTSFAEEQIRGAQILNDIGDYHNTSLLVQFLQSIGGVFTTFHMGIAPRAGLTDLLKSSLTADKKYQHLPVTMQMLRLQNEINEEQPVPGYHLEQGGPVGATVGIPDPNNIASTASLGPVGSTVVHGVAQLLDRNAKPWDVGRGIKEGLQDTIPAYAGAAQLVPGSGLSPYKEPASLPDWLLVSSLLGPVYLQKNDNQWVIRRKEASWRKGMQRAHLQEEP
jgi:hypothetical protein